MSANIVRLAYVVEFLIALVAILDMWSEVGGQDHLDMMPWYTKFFLTFGLALVIVMGTAAAVGHESAWNAKTFACIALALLLAAAIAGVTYYYHIHEDADSGDDSVAILVSPVGEAGALLSRTVR